MTNTTVKLSVDSDDLDLIARIGALFGEPIATEFSGGTEDYAAGWNDALDYAVEQLTARLDELVSVYENSGSQGVAIALADAALQAKK